MSCSKTRASFHPNDDKSQVPQKQHNFNAQFSGKIAQIKRLRFFLFLKVDETSPFGSFLQSSNARYVFREICLAENSDVVRARES